MNISVVPELVIAYLLVFARIGTMIMLLPGLGEQMLTTRARLSLALLITLILFPLVRTSLPAGGSDNPGLIRLLVGEVLVGLMFGLCARLLMSVLQTAGTVVALQMGLSFAQSFDPDRGSTGQSVLLANFFTLLAITLIFASDLHHVAIMGLVDSYRTLTPGQLPMSGDAAELAIGIVGSSFSTAIRISAPFLVFGIVFNLGLGVLSRMMPQVQVFFLALPANIILGTLVLIAVLTIMMDGFLGHLARGFALLFPGV